MQSISTKTGDAGETGLANGKRVPKDSPVIELIGTVDELNSWLGLVVVEMQEAWQEHHEFLLTVQETLFYIGAEIAQSPKAKLSETQLTKLEQKATVLQDSMEDHWHSKFLLPGGTKLGAQLDLARAVCRRCERLAFGYTKKTTLSPLILQYFNRLSDYLYLLRTFVNSQQDYSEKQFLVSK
jgi:cob(I)alamin adenosyltransferase